MSFISSGTTSLHDPVRILHVDDDPHLADLTAEFLQRENTRFVIETATGVSDGLAILAQNTFDCIVSDYEMPGQTGLEFLKLVREDYPLLPFILYTGRGSEEVASDAIAAGVTDYLQKKPGRDQYTILANRIGNAVEQYRSRQQIEETEQKLSQLAEETTDILFMFNGDWSELLFVNSAYEDIWGDPISDLQADPRSFLNRIHPDDREYAMQAMEPLSNGEPIALEYRVIRADGEQRWIHGESKALVDDKGNVSRIVGSVRDTTEAKERECDLRRQERRYQAVFNDPNILIGLLDTDGTILNINEVAMDYIDVPLSDITGKPFWETPWFDQSASLQQELKEWIVRAAEGDYVEFELDLVRPTGTPYSIAGVIRPVTNEAGDVVSLLISDQDITEQKQQEREVKETNALLSALFETLPVGLTLTR